VRGEKGEVEVEVKVEVEVEVKVEVEVEVENGAKVRRVERGNCSAAGPAGSSGWV
jgi:hypothetical protein